MLRPMLDTLPRPLAYVTRHLLIAVPLCTFIALFLSTAFSDPLGRMLVFSFSIGLSCQFLIDLGRHAVARWLSRTRPDSEPLRRGWPGWQWTLPIIVLGVAGGIQIGFAIAGWILGMPVSPPAFDNWRSWFIILSTSLLASIGVTAFFWSRGRLAAAEAQAQGAQRAAAENQLKLLESQLEPHMLFNTLANLRVLIALDPPKAQAMLDRLIAFLRATLQASRSGTHALADEFARLDDYLALMAVRMGPRLAVTFDLPDTLRTAPVPPLLLQPLVENSIKHGLEPQLAGGRVEIRAERDGDRLLLSVRDDGAGLAASASSLGTRFGLQQVRQRLAALYGPAASLSLDAAPGGGTLARISLPLPLPASH
jgi:signal transduction histidine kinase